jgi:cell cycle arrest protein BUB2
LNAAAAMSSHALRNSRALTGRNMAYDHLALERLIRDGPPDGDFESALESARYKVLQQEVKSDTDGMVSW